MTTSPTPEDEERARPPLSALWSVQGRLWPKSPTNLSGKGVLAFIRRAIDSDASTLVTDEYGAYNVVRRIMDHCVIQHSKRYAICITGSQLLPDFSKGRSSPNRDGPQPRTPSPRTRENSLRSASNHRLYLTSARRTRTSPRLHW